MILALRIKPLLGEFSDKISSSSIFGRIDKINTIYS